MGAAQKRAGHGGDVQSAHLAQHIQHVVFIRVVQRQRTAQHLLFPGKALVGQSASPTGDGVHLRVQQHRQHGGAGGGVADAHFPHAQQVDPVGLSPGGGFHSGGKGLQGFGAGHGRFHGHVAGAPTHLAIQHGITVHIGVDAHVDDGYVVSKGLSQRRHTGFAAGHVDGLLQRDGLGGAGHPLGHHAVVGGEHRHTALFDGGAHPAGDARHADGHILQLSQTSRWLGQRRLTAAGGGHGRLVRAADGRQIGFQFLFRHSVISPR